MDRGSRSHDAWIDPGDGDATAKNGDIYHSPVVQWDFLKFASSAVADAAVFAFNKAPQQSVPSAILFLSTVRAFSFITDKAGCSREDP